MTPWQVLETEQTATNIAGRAFTVTTEQVAYPADHVLPERVSTVITFTGPNGAGYTPVPATRKPGVYTLVSFKGGPWRKQGNLVLVKQAIDGGWVQQI